jgi:hypothetical protein
MGSILRVLWLGLIVCLSMVSTAFAEEEEAAEAAEGAEGDAAEEPEGPPKNCPVPDKVKVGAYINNIQNLDLKTHTYEFDFYVWFKWCNPDLDPATSMEFMNPSELWGLMATPNYEEPEEFEDGTLYQVVRVQGKYNTKMPLYSYPFDRQRIGPFFEDSVSDTTEMTYELDGPTAIGMNPAMVLPGYLLGQPELVLEATPYPTDFGDARSAERPSYSRGFIVVPLSRPLISQMTLLFAPVGSVMICAALMFMLSPVLIDSRIGVGTTAMLTVVALQMTYNQELPDVGYLMLMDKVYLASYAYVLVGLGIVMYTTPGDALPVEGVSPAMNLHRLNRIGLITTSGAYITVCVVLCLLASMAG